MSVRRVFNQGSPRGPRRRGFALAALTILAGGLTPIALAPQAAVADPPPCVTTQPDEASASAMALACATWVEVLGLRTEVAQVFARPEGGFTSEQTAAPRWARVADGTWAPIDTTLHASADGTVGPAVTVLPVLFSGGGTGPLARLRAAGGKEIAVSWPGGALPAPTLAGDSATYPNVLPDVDLKVTANALGFTQVLVVKTRAAAATPALKTVRFGLATTGVTASTTADGGIVAADAAGVAVFNSPTPMMWDSAEGTTNTPKGGTGENGNQTMSDPTQAAMPVTVADGQLSVVPDAAMVTDPATVYPLYIDPGWSGYIKDKAWTTVWSRSGLRGTSFWQRNDAAEQAGVKGGAPAGRTCDGIYSDATCATEQYLVRSMFRMDTSQVVGKNITGASFRIQQQWAWTCGNGGTKAKLWLTDDIFSWTTWDVQPTWYADHTALAAGNHRVDRKWGCDGTGDVEFDATDIVKTGIAKTGAHITVGLRAADEGTTSQWKRFNAGTPVLAIDYNNPPNKPDTLTVEGKTCATGAARPFVPTATPTLKARATDPDSDSMQLWIAAVKWNGTKFDEATAVAGYQDKIASGTYGQWTTPALVGDGIYAFRAQANDYGKGGAPGPVTNIPGNCEFQVDLVDPVVPTVASTEYPENSTGCAPEGCGSVGYTGKFTFRSSADVVRYRWGFGSLTTDATPAKMGDPVEVSWTPQEGESAPKVLLVQAIDRAGRTSTKTYRFVVRTPQPAVGWWPLNETAGTTALVNKAHPGTLDATLANGTLGAAGRLRGGETVAHFDGLSTTATAPHAVDTSRSFSVAAWVRTADTTAIRAAVSQDGTHIPGFRLQFGTGCNCWQFAVPKSDSGGPGSVIAAAPTPAAPNVWSHLVGVYNSGTATISLFVDGLKVAEVAAPAVPWNAPGKLTIGRSQWNDLIGDYWKGDIADVRLWDRAISPAEATAVADPQVTGKVGEWHFSEASGDTAYDSTNYLNDLKLTLAPGATWGPGRVGTGIHLDGTGYATTDKPVLNTDQSFTLSTWARMTGSALPAANMTALGQDGASQSSFYLGYRQWAGDARWSFTCTSADADAATFTHARTPTPLTASAMNTWTHLVGVYDASAGELRLYVNDVLEATTPCRIWNAGSQLAVGRGRYQGGLVDRWVGDLDEVRVYAGVVVPSRVLTVDGPRSGAITAANGTCMDLTSANTADGTPLQIYGCNGSAPQSWTYDGLNRSVTAYGKCVEARGAAIQLMTCNGTSGQLWTYDPATRGLKALTGCLDIPNGVAAPGTKLQLYACNGTDAQRWTFS